MHMSVNKMDVGDISQTAVGISPPVTYRASEAGYQTSPRGNGWVSRSESQRQARPLPHRAA
ncbi:hypothetical protein PG994_008308 [Apiospora phragmitis]|uniref:Uncharacterized protein n=1 Tax=Apiospora phragmitis TaxID=2905665 RepID=A0ABR1UTB8_9PEZI